MKTLRETIAEAIYRHPNRDVSDAYKIADDALATVRQWLADEGLAVVPREATSHMCTHASLVEVDDIELTPSEYCAAWRAMIAAAPDALKAPDPSP